MQRKLQRKLVVMIPQLNEDHRAAIRETAERYGLEACFFEDTASAAADAKEAEILFTWEPALMEDTPKLRWLCVPSAGVNQVPPEAFLSGRAVLTNSSGAYGVTIAEHIVMVTLELMRRRAEYRDIIARRVWQRDLPIRSIRCARITLLGTGDIGQEAAVRLRAFGPASLTGVNRHGGNPGSLFDRTVTVDRLAEVLPETDLLIVSLPGTPDTAHLLDGGLLAALPDGAIVVNVGRGSVIDEAAMEKELRAGRLQAALDVYEREPLPQDSPMWDCPNLLMTPHVAGNMTLPWTVDRIAALFLEDLENYCVGRPLKRQVDLRRGY